MKHAVILSVFLLFGFGTVLSAAVAQNLEDVSVEQPWARASIGTSRPAAAYFTVTNKGRKAVRLVGIETPVAGRAALHRTSRSGDVFRMEPAGDVEIPPGERLTLVPGSYHVMMTDLLAPILKGETFPLTLRFANGRRMEVTVPVLGPGSRGPGR